MKPAKYDFTIYQGSAFSRTLTWKDDNGTPINLAGYTARLQATKSTGAAVKEIDLGADEITLGGAAGTIAINIPSSDTADYDFDQAVYNLELIPPSGEANKYRLMYGVITLDRDVVL